VPGDQLLDAAVDCATKIALNAPQAEAKTKLLLRRFSGQAMGLQMTDYTAIPHLEGEARLGLEAFFSHQRPPWAPAALPASPTH
jgi:enoyl-CoA hydratase/carnithine racemase